jgi:hypothetical protein
VKAPVSRAIRGFERADTLVARCKADWPVDPRSAVLDLMTAFPSLPIRDAALILTGRHIISAGRLHLTIH